MEEKCEWLDLMWTVVGNLTFCEAFRMCAALPGGSRPVVFTQMPLDFTRVKKHLREAMTLLNNKFFSRPQLMTVHETDVHHCTKQLGFVAVVN